MFRAVDKLLKNIVLVLFFLTFYFSMEGQNYLRTKVVDGDTLAVCVLPTVTVGGRDYTKPPKFKSKRESWRYTKMKAYVKKVYPYAQLASEKLKECEAEIQKDPESKRQAMRKVEKALRKRYGKEMKSLTVTQGKLLLLLIDRQTGLTTFELVQELKGNFNASMYQGIAVLFGHSLKLNYEPRGKHWMIEDIVQKIEMGII